MQVSYKLVSSQESDKAVPELAANDEKQNRYQILFWCIIGIGVLLRLFHFIDNRSLWIDEIYLSTSIIKMGYAELATSSLEYQQKAPIGFLWLVRLCVDLFGIGERSLRLIPLIGGIASLFLFLPVAKRVLSPLGALLAMSILALAPPLIYHSVEIKQYSTDLFASVLALYFYVRYQHDLRYTSLLLWGMLGAILLWFSFPVIFILAGIAAGLSLYYLINKDWNAFFRSLIPFIIWLISFATNFFLFTAKHTEAEWLISWFRTRQGFVPLGTSIFGVFTWVVQALYRLLDFPLEVLWNADPLASIDSTALRVILKMAPFLVLFWAIGIFYYYKADKKLFMVLVFPIVLTLVAALLNKYPFYERLMVFIAPIPIIFLAQGCTSITNFFRKKSKLSYLFPLILVGWPLWSSASHVANTDLFWEYKKSYYREGLFYINERFQEGDVVYIYWNAKPAYRYHKAAYDLKYTATELTDARFLVKDEHEYVERLRAEYGNTEGVKRIWFVYEPFLMLEIGDYDHTPSWYHYEGIKGGDMIRKDMSTMGTEIDQFWGQNIGISLYELSSK